MITKVIRNHKSSTPRSQRTPIRTFKPANADVVACMTYSDPELGIVALSIRSTLGIMRASTGIHWDAGVFDNLVASGCQWLECRIKDTNTTYRTSVDTMREHGQLQRRYGWQRVLHLKYWSVDGDEPEAFKPQGVGDCHSQPEATQPSLFEITEPARKGAAY